MLKVVWLCHFVNQELKSYFNIQTSKPYEAAPWINNLAELFRNIPQIELHIVAPNIFNNTDSSFVNKNVYYHLYSHRSRYLPRKINTALKLFINPSYHGIQNKIATIIHEINPNIIHLHGAENPYYSSGIIPLVGKYPILLTIQGFVRNSSVKNYITNRKVILEEQIIKSISHFGVRTQEMSRIVKSINSTAQLHYHEYPFTFPKFFKQYTGTNESIDCIFFARIERDKGIEDLLAAVAIVKRKFPNISVVIIGASNNRYLTFLKKILKKLSIQNNVSFLGFLSTQEQVYKVAMTAKFCVLPTYHDIIPGTIIESMFLKLPVISYSVGGIPELNRNKPCLILVDKQNIIQLSDRITELLENDNLRKNLAENAYAEASKRFNNEKLVNDILGIYESILKQSANEVA